LLVRQRFVGSYPVTGHPKREHAGVCFLVICSAMYATETGFPPVLSAIEEVLLQPAMTPVLTAATGYE
jgi:hypothetical protein